MLQTTLSDSQYHILWSIGELVQDPCFEVVLVHDCVLQLSPKTCWSYGIKSTGEVKKHNSYIATNPLGKEGSM